MKSWKVLENTVHAIIAVEFSSNRPVFGNLQDNFVVSRRTLKKSNVDDISTALQIGIAHDCFAAKEKAPNSKPDFTVAIMR